jgi:hypothetical protein
MNPRATIAFSSLLLLAAALRAEDPPGVASPEPTPQQQVDSLLARARSLPDAQRIPLYEQAARLAPDRAEAWCGLAAAQIRSGQARRAREAAAKALAFAPGLYEARLNAAALACVEASADGVVEEKSLSKLDPPARDLASLRRDHPARRGAAWTLLWIAFQRGGRDGMLAAASTVAAPVQGNPGLTTEEVQVIVARSAPEATLSRAVARWTALEESLDCALVEGMPALSQPPGSHVSEEDANDAVRAFLAASWPEDTALMERALAPAAGGRGAPVEVTAAGLSVLRLAVLHRRSASPTLVYEKGQCDALAGILPLLREKAILEAALRSVLRPVAAYVGEVEEP